MLTNLRITQQTETRKDGELIEIAVMIELTDDEIKNGPWTGRRCLTGDALLALPKEGTIERDDAIRAWVASEAKAAHATWRAAELDVPSPVSVKAVDKIEIAEIDRLAETHLNRASANESGNQVG